MVEEYALPARLYLTAGQSVAGPLERIACSGEIATDGLWARLRDGVKRMGVKRVGIVLLGCASGLVGPRVVAKDKERGASWGSVVRPRGRWNGGWGGSKVWRVMECRGN